MCGIYGKIRFDGRPADEVAARRRCELMRHRGPDDAGLWADGAAVLGHRRLSIIDLSPRGHQPMGNEDQTLWIVFNGEIYNHADLRPGLEAKGHTFRSRTDTEVILHLYEEEGPACVERLRGMFAFAIWNSRARTLFLARDRVGKKPLFYHHGQDSFAFASELSALVADEEVPRDVDRVAIHHYLTFQSVPCPSTAYRAVRKVPPAHWLLLRDGQVHLRRYWRLSFVPKLAADGRRQRAELAERVLETLRESVRRRLVSDVPLGALLSGGVDSSAIVALMAREAGASPVRTFSVGFEEEDYNELRWARMVARAFATEHHEFVLRPDRAAVLPLLVEHFGEPFADPAAIPLYFVAQTAREHVTVVLCGDGGDEAFAGYHRHKLNAVLARLPRMPGAAARLLGRLLPAGPKGTSSRNPLWIARRFAETASLHPAVRNLRFFGHFDTGTKSQLYTHDFARETAGQETEALVLDRFAEAAADHPLDAILATDLETYLADTLLPKVDIASMANSLEVRSPLLDHEVLELAARLPFSLKVRGLETKYILKRALAGLLPAEILRRPKMGFGVPLDRWFRGELRELVRDTLLSPSALGRGYFRAQEVRRIIEEHEAGRRQWQYGIYNLLMLELWHRRFAQ